MDGWRYKARGLWREAVLTLRGASARTSICPRGYCGLQEWRNRCTLRMSVHTLWDPASISLEFQYDTYTGVRDI